jgi:hypothetical protein
MYTVQILHEFNDESNKIEEYQIIPRGGSCAKRHCYQLEQTCSTGLVEVVKQIRCRKMFAVHSLEPEVVVHSRRRCASSDDGWRCTGGSEGVGVGNVDGAQG